MRKTKTLRQLCLLLLIVLISQCSKDEQPSGAFTISPDTGSGGTSVTITGTGFSATAANNIVKFNGKDATVTSATVTQIVAEVPDGAGTGAVTVQVDGKTQQGPVFTYTEPQVTKAYYFKFKANGSVKVFETAEPGYSACGDCSCSILPPLNSTRGASLDICQQSNNWVTAANILSWNKKKIPFTGSTFPIADFGFAEGGVDYESHNASDQTGSSVDITNVENDGQYYGHPAYKVSGTFQCKVAKSGGTAVSITEGTFVVRFTEDY